MALLALLWLFKVTFNADHANNFLRFGTGNVERMRVTSDGRLLVGTTNPSTAAGQGLKLNFNQNPSFVTFLPTQVQLIHSFIFIT